MGWLSGLDRYKEGAEGGGVWKIFDYLILKWHVLILGFLALAYLLKFYFAT